MNTATKQWLEFVQASSIPLRCLDANDLPLLGLASGCMIEYRGRRILLSVFHATSKPGKWAIELRYDKETRRTKLYYPGAFNYLAEMTLGVSQINDVDFSYTEIPKTIESTFQHLTPSGVCLAERRRTIFTTTLQVQPSHGEVYAFSGQVQPDFFHDANALVTEHQTYPGLKYVRTEGGHHFFRLPVKHPGHEYFQGCSGSPILDTKCNVVALVCGGDIESGEIYGIDLSKYRSALDITYSQFPASESNGLAST